MNIVLCPSKLFLHIPCPGCGTTRATILFLKGHFLEALYKNPMVILAIAFLVGYPVMLIVDMVTKKSHLLPWSRAIDGFLKKKYVLFPVLVCVLLNWIWNFIKGN